MTVVSHVSFFVQSGSNMRLSRVLELSQHGELDSQHLILLFSSGFSMVCEICDNLFPKNCQVMLQ